MNFTLALVTGASSGIGESLCHLLASKGINLIITGRDVVALNEVAEALRKQVTVDVQPFDLKLPEQREKLCQIIREKAPELVVNNAGFGLYGDALTHETASQSEILEVNGQAVLEISLEAARTLVSYEKTGVIMNISSSAGFMPFPAFTVYAASKAFVNNFSESLDQELKPYGIRVLAACPGMVATKFKQRAAKEPSKEVADPEKGPVMTREFAAAEIWKQIEMQKTIHIFNGHYRFLIFLVRFIVPKWLLMKVLPKQISERHQHRPIIKINKT